MSDVTFKVAFGNQPPRASVSALSARRPTGEPADAPSAAARYLAMAHRMEHLLCEGRLKNYAAAGAWLGVSAHSANLINSLVLLAPPIQEAVLCGDTRLSARQLRGVARLLAWEEQLAAVAELDPALDELSLQAEGSPRSSTTTAAARRTPQKDAP